jgi:hypothetical protein
MEPLVSRERAGREVGEPSAGAFDKAGQDIRLVWVHGYISALLARPCYREVRS